MSATVTYAEASLAADRTDAPSRPARTWVDVLLIVAQVWTEAREMHRASQKRYPFMDN